MVIFRIISNLFRIVTRGLFSIFWLPLSIVSKAPFLVLGIIGLFLLYVAAGDHERDTRQQKANPARTITVQGGKKVQVASPVARVEDGDSAFANDLYVQMTDEEKALYSQTFYFVMNTVADGQSHRWNGVDIHGTLLPDHTFTNKMGERCRMFSEVLKVHAVQQQLTGMACQGGNGTWCKLQANATPGCHLGHNPTFMDSVSSSLKRLF